MGIKNKYEKNVNAFAKIGIGAAVSVIVTAVLVAAVSSLISREVIGEEISNFLVPLIQVVAACIGCFIGSQNVEDLKPAIIFGASATYYVLLIATAVLIFDSTFAGVLTGLVSVLAGSFIALLFRVRTHSRMKGKRFRIRTR